MELYPATDAQMRGFAGRKGEMDMKRDTRMMLCVALALTMALTGCGKRDEKTVGSKEADATAQTSPEGTDYAPEGPLEAAEQGLLTNTYVDPQADYTMLYDGSWKVNERYNEFQKGVSILYYRSCATIDNQYVGDMNNYAAYVKESVIAQDVVKDITFSTRQDARYFLVEYSYELDGSQNRWTAVCDPTKQIALFFQFCSADKAEYEKFLPEVDAMLSTLDIRAEYKANAVQTADASESKQPVDVASVKQNLSDRSGLIGKWGKKKENGESDLQLLFKDDGKYVRYKSMGDENNCYQGTWEYKDSQLIIHNTAATIEGEASNNFTPDVTYDIVGFSDGEMTIINTASRLQSNYEFLGDE